MSLLLSWRLAGVVLSCEENDDSRAFIKHRSRVRVSRVALALAIRMGS